VAIKVIVDLIGLYARVCTFRGQHAGGCAWYVSGDVVFLLWVPRGGDPSDHRPRQGGGYSSEEEETSFWRFRRTAVVALFLPGGKFRDVEPEIPNQALT